MAKVNSSSLYNFQDGVTVTEANLDQNFEVMRVAQNDTDDRVTTLDSSLISTVVGASGAHKLKSAPITGITGSSVFEMMQSLKSLIDGVVLGDIPDGSITQAKLDPDVTTDIRISTNAEFRVEVRNTDPVSPVAGRIWLRSDL